MPIETKIVEVYKKPLFIAYKGKEKNQILAKKLTVRKKSGLLN